MQLQGLDAHGFVAEIINFDNGEYLVRSVPHVETETERLNATVIWTGGPQVQHRSDHSGKKASAPFSPVTHAKIIRAIKHRLKQRGYEPLWNHYQYVIKPIGGADHRVDVMPLRPNGLSSAAVVSRAPSTHGEPAVEIKSWLTLPKEWRIWQTELEQAVLHRCVSYLAL